MAVKPVFMCACACLCVCVCVGSEPRNHAAWSVPESEERTSSRLPLFINSFPLTASKDSAKVKYKLCCIQLFSVLMLVIWVESSQNVVWFLVS